MKKRILAMASVLILMLTIPAFCDIKIANRR